LISEKNFELDEFFDQLSIEDTIFLLKLCLSEDVLNDDSEDLFVEIFTKEMDLLIIFNSIIFTFLSCPQILEKE